MNISVSFEVKGRAVSVVVKNLRNGFERTWDISDEVERLRLSGEKPGVVVPTETFAGTGMIAVSQRQLLSAAKDTAFVAENEYTRDDRRSTYVERALRRQVDEAVRAEVTGVADITSEIDIIFPADALIGQNHDRNLVKFILPQFLKAQKEGSVLGKESIFVAGEGSEHFGPTLKFDSKSLSGTKKVMFVTNGKMDPRAQLKAILDAAEVSSEIQEKVFQDFGVVVVHELSQAGGEEYAISNVANMLTMARISARVRLDKFNILTDLVKLFIRDMIPRVLSGEIALEKALKVMHQYDPNFSGDYLRLAMKIITVKVDEMLQFTRNILKAIGGAA